VSGCGCGAVIGGFIYHAIGAVNLFILCAVMSTVALFLAVVAVLSYPDPSDEVCSDPDVDTESDIPPDPHRGSKAYTMLKMKSDMNLVESPLHD
jgi:hypothetical protein